jgi:acyl carrier protein
LIDRAAKNGGSVGVFSEMQLTAKDIKDQVRTYILQDLLLDSGGAIADDASLLSAGALDSTAAMELVFFLHDNFGCTVDDDEITLDNLDTLNSITALVQRKSSAL